MGACSSGVVGVAVNVRALQYRHTGMHCKELRCMGSAMQEPGCNVGACSSGVVGVAVNVGALQYRHALQRAQMYG